MYTIHVVLKDRAYDQWFKVWGEALRYANQQIFSHSPNVIFICIDRQDGTTICAWDGEWSYYGKGVI